MDAGFAALKDKSGADKIIVKKHPYQLLNTSREFFASFDAPIFHKLGNESKARYRRHFVLCTSM